MESIYLRSIGLTYLDVDRLISALPKGLRQLNVGGNDIGAAGIEKLHHYQKKLEEDTGLPFELITD